MAKSFIYRPKASSTEWLRPLLDVARGDHDFEDYYGDDPEEILRECGSDGLREGNLVRWVSYGERMIQIDPDYAVATVENIFDPEKLSAVVRRIEESSKYGKEKPTLYVGYGTVRLIDKLMVKESQNAFSWGEENAERALEDVDVGCFQYRIGDGNHRVFGALLAGETRIWMRIADSQWQDVQDYRKAKKERTLKAFKEQLWSPNRFKTLKMLDENSGK